MYAEKAGNPVPEEFRQLPPRFVGILETDFSQVAPEPARSAHKTLLVGAGRVRTRYLGYYALIDKYAQHDESVF
jgi:hypothetical protein